MFPLCDPPELDPEAAPQMHPLHPVGTLHQAETPEAGKRALALRMPLVLRALALRPAEEAGDRSPLSRLPEDSHKGQGILTDLTALKTRLLTLNFNSHLHIHVSTICRKGQSSMIDCVLESCWGVSYACR